MTEDVCNDDNKNAVRSKITRLTETAPVRIWLQVADDDSYNHGRFPGDHEGITWCEDSVLAAEVQYIRADICPTLADFQEMQSKFQAAEARAAMRIQFDAGKPRGGAVKGKFGGSNQTDLNLTLNKLGA